MRGSQWAILVGVLALAGCGGGGDRTERSRDAGGRMGRMDSGGMGTEPMDSGRMGMSGMNMQGMPMMSRMRAHTDSMMWMSPQQMQGMMAMHQAMMSRMLDGMGADMRAMKMSGTPEWNALTDSVKQDLADLPQLEGPELQARMRAHAERVRRLILMHEGMMQATQR